jgi:hypothetical protein
MRKLIFFTIVGFGAFVGILSARHDSWGLRFVMMMVGVLVAVPIGGLAFAGIGKSPQVGRGRQHKQSALTGQGLSIDDLAANYWRDNGHPPFMNPSDAIPDSNVNHPDKI